MIRELLDHPRRFTFFQCVRLLERLTGGEMLGGQNLPRQETIRLRAHASLGFPPWDIEEVATQPNPWERPPLRYLVTVTFLGLYGPASPLPTTYTDLIIRPQEDEDPEDRDRVRDFMDIFNHRMMSLLYRIFQKYRYHLTYEPGAGDTFSQYMLSLIGRGTRGMPGQRPIHPERMIRYAGLLTQNPRGAASLEGLLRDFLLVPVRIQQCMGRWLRVEDRNEMGGAFCRLGQDMIVGASVYDRTGKFRISVGPVGLAEFGRFLPTGELMAQLRELVRLYLIDHLEFDLEVWLRGDEVPLMTLGGEGAAPAMLGWTSWALTESGPDRAVVFRC
jgi:type VI secretion system protein ImpH